VARLDIANRWLLAYPRRLMTDNTKMKAKCNQAIPKQKTS
jgi:hypothetical protein